MSNQTLTKKQEHQKQNLENVTKSIVYFHTWNIFVTLYVSHCLSVCLSFVCSLAVQSRNVCRAVGLIYNCVNRYKTVFSFVRSFIAFLIVFIFVFFFFFFFLALNGHRRMPNSIVIIFSESTRNERLPDWPFNVLQGNLNSFIEQLQKLSSFYEKTRK